MDKSLSELKQELRDLNIKGRSKYKTKEEIVKALTEYKNKKLYFDLLPKELLYETLLTLDYDTIDNYCNTSEKFKNICNDEKFWKEKLKIDFNSTEPRNGSFKASYLNKIFLANLNSGRNIIQDHKTENKQVNEWKNYIAITENKILNLENKIKATKLEIINIGRKEEIKAAWYNYERKNLETNNLFTNYYNEELSITKEEYEELKTKKDYYKFIPQVDIENWIIFLGYNNGVIVALASDPNHLNEFDIYNFNSDKDKKLFAEYLQVMGDGSVEMGCIKFGLAENYSKFFSDLIKSS